MKTRNKDRAREGWQERGLKMEIDAGFGLERSRGGELHSTSLSRIRGKSVPKGTTIGSEAFAKIILSRFGKFTRVVVLTSETSICQLLN